MSDIFYIFILKIEEHISVSKCRPMYCIAFKRFIHRNVKILVKDYQLYVFAMLI